MRWMLALVAGVLVLLQPAYFFLLRSCADPGRDQVSHVADPCQGLRDDHLPAASVEDRLLKDNLIRQGLALIERGSTVDAASLGKQLGVGSCQLDLPSPGPSVNGSAELFRIAKDSVVIVAGLYKCNKCSRWHADTASGFVISSSGAVVTNFHVVDSSTERALLVMTADSHVYPVERILAASRADDLAILKVDAEGLQPLPLAGSADARPLARRSASSVTPMAGFIAIRRASSRGT